MNKSIKLVIFIIKKIDNVSTQKQVTLGKITEVDTLNRLVKVFVEFENMFNHV